jgi:hypothetical protein
MLESKPITSGISKAGRANAPEAQNENAINVHTIHDLFHTCTLHITIQIRLIANAVVTKQLAIPKNR